MSNEEIKIPKVFISYSWSSSDKVLELAERLMANGVDVVLDKWDLKEGQDKYVFMEQSVNNSEIDKVLIICDEKYATKANLREGGVGDETVIISPEIYNNISQEKFIPVIFEIDENGNPYCPAYIKSRIYIDLSKEDEKYEENYEKLLRNIHNKPLYRKPSIGTIPEWLENESVDLSSVRDIIKQMRGYNGGNSTKVDFLIRKFDDEFIKALIQYNKTDIPYDEALLGMIDEEKILRDLYIDYLDIVIYNDLHIESIVPSFIEKVYNVTHDAKGKNSSYDSDFEFFDYVIWELLICTVAVLLYYEKYAALNQILIHSYFLKKSYFDESIENHTYAIFRKYFRTIEEICKPKSENPRYHTLAGETLVKREKKPIITKTSMANADILLYQMHNALNLNGKKYLRWFPLLYHHSPYGQNMWYKLKSKVYCEKIMPLFGVSTIEKMKDIISQSSSNRETRHSESFDSAPNILSSIKLDEIGSIN